MKQNTNRLSRRQFIKTSGAVTAGLGVPGSATPRMARSHDMEHYSSMTEPEHLGVDPERLQAVVDFLDAEFASGSFPGAALLATRRGKSVLCEYRGTYCGRVTRDEPYRSDVVNMCFSFSKVITATVVVMAQQDSLFDYDAPVSTYIPAFKGGGKDRITVRQCLTHSAGIPGPPMVAALTEEGWQRNLDALCKHDVEWPPGSKTDYHAWSGAFLSAAVVRAVSGMKPWNEICRERLFDPLGADTMTFGLPPADVAVAITPQSKGLPTPLDAAHFGLLGHPGGGCFAQANDMLRLLKLHLEGGVWNGKRLINIDAHEEMHRVQYAREIEAAHAAGAVPAHEYWALGWLTRGKTKTGWFGFGDTVSERSFGHAGIDTVIGVADPETGLSLAFLTTDSPRSKEETKRLRNTVTNLVAKAVE